MRKFKLIAVIWLVFFAISVTGCSLFPQKNEPIKPRSSTNQKAPSQSKSSPTKRVPGMSTVTKKQVHERVTKIEEAVKKDDWNKANKETKTLGVDMTKFYPLKAKGKSLRKMAGFDTSYLKLYRDIKAKNKTACLKDTKDLKLDLSKIK